VSAHRVSILVLALAVLFGCNRIAATQSGASVPNLLLVTIDTLRADHVGAYGHPHARTPVLDRLAAEGTRFATAISAAPLTLPSHASILTGLYPPRHGARYNGVSRLEPRFDTLTERLRERGYATGAVVGAYVLAAKYGLEQGFQQYDDETRSRGDPAQRSATEVTDRALAWLARTKRPFFLWAHYYDPHERYEPPEPFASAFAGRPYDGEVAYVDSELGRLLEALRAQRDFENTLIVVTSDHGESLGEHAELTHSYTLYDAVLAVPLVLRGPGVPSARVVEGVVRSVDIAPTLASLLDLPSLGEVDGSDLSLLWDRSAPAPERLAFAETLATRLEHGWSPLFAIRTREHHYVRAPRRELYDVASDPGQQVNRIEHDPEQVLPVAAALDEEISRILAAQVYSSRPHLDDTTREQLHSLGYALPERELPETGVDPKDGLRALRDLDFESGNAAFAANDFVLAESIFSRVVERLPGSAYARAMLALCYLQTGRAPKAIPHLELAQRLAPEQRDHYTALIGDAQLLIGDPDAALAAYEIAARLNPENPSAQIGLMLRALRGADLAEAEVYADRAQALTLGASATTHVNIGRNWERLGQYERAHFSYQQALSLDPGSSLAHLNLAIALARLSGSASQPGVAASRARQTRGGDRARSRLLSDARLHLAATSKSLRDEPIGWRGCREVERSPRGMLRPWTECSLLTSDS
jgi:arylsulfatase A-like enzyme/Tfp pilus assembly protein PilF